MVASGDAEAGEKVVYHSPESSLPSERSEGRSDTSSQGDTADKGNVEPVDVLVPIAPGHWRVCNVRLIWVVFRVSVWLRLGSHWRRLLVFGDEGRVDGTHASDSLVRGHCGLEDRQRT